MPGPLDFALAPPADDVVKAAPVADSSPLGFALHPPEQESAQDIVRNSQFAGNDWAAANKKLTAAGYKMHPDAQKAYETQMALKAEREKQGEGVGTVEQFVRHSLPVASAVLNTRREGSYQDAVKRYQEGGATQDDLSTIATYERRAKADQQINSTFAGQALSIPLAAPAILGETIGAGKLLGAAGKALGVGQVAAQSTGRAVLNYAGKQALMTPLVPSMYLEAAAQKNVAEGRNATDVRGFAPAIGLGYANMLVLGSLQKFGNTGSFGVQVLKKGAIGVGEQAIADVATGAADEFLPKAYQMGTKYGVLGDIARGKAGDGLKHAAVQMLTFSYFAALHGKNPNALLDAGKDLMNATKDAGGSPEAAADKFRPLFDRIQTQMNRKLLQGATEAHAEGAEFTREDAANLMDMVRASKKGLTTAEGEAFEKMAQAAIDSFPTKVRKEKRPVDPTVRDDLIAHGDEGPIHEPAEASPKLPEQSSFPTTGEPVRAAPEPVSRPVEAAPRPEVAPQVRLLSEPRPGTPVSLGAKERHTRYDFTDADGKTGHAEVRVKDNGDLHLNWVARDGAATGEGKGSVGSATMNRAVQELANHYPDADRITGIRAPEAGKRTDIDLSAVRRRMARQGLDVVPPTGRKAAETAPASDLNPTEGKSPGWVATYESMKSLVGEKTAQEIADKDHPPAPKPEIGSARTFVAEQIAPNAVAQVLPKVPPKVTAERRSAPFRAKVDKESQVTPQERAAEADPEFTHAPATGPLPTASRLRSERVMDRLRRVGASDVPEVQARLKEAYEKFGSEAHDDLVGYYEEVAKQAEAHKRVRSGLKDTDPEVTADEVEAAESGAYNYQQEMANEQRRRAESRPAVGDTPASAEARRSQRAKSERAFQDGVQAADQAADAAVVGKRAEKAAEPAQPRQAAGAAVKPVSEARAEERRRRSLRDYSDLTPDEVSATKEYNRKRDAFVNQVLKYAEGADPATREILEGIAWNLPFNKTVGSGGWKSVAGGRSAKGYGADTFAQDVRDALHHEGHAHAASRGKPAGAVIDSLLKEFGGGRLSSFPTTGKKPPRIATVADAVRDAGGLVFDEGMKKFYTDQGSAVKNQELPLRIFNEKGRSIEQLAKELKRHVGSDDPQDLINALKENRPSRLAERGDADEYALKEHLRQQEELHRSAGGERFAPSEEIPWSRGARGGTPDATPSGDGTVGPFEIIAEQNKLFGHRNYVEKSVPGAPGDVSAAARLKEGATVTRKLAAGDPEVNLEEHAHHVQRENGLPIDPASYPVVVARGIQQFFAPRMASYDPRASAKVPTRLGMIEGFADWLIARSQGRLTGLSPEQEVANQYLEKWAKEKGLTAKFDAIKTMYTEYNSRSAAGKAAGNVSATGKPVEAERTYKEVATSLGEKLESDIVNDLAVLERAGRAAEANGAPKGLAKRVYQFYSQLMFADKPRAAEFERDGVHTFVDGRKQVIGLPLAKIVEGAKPEWLKAGPNGEASKAGTYAVARHVVGEAERGKADLVSGEQLELYRKLLEEVGRDEAFKAWAEPFAKRLTESFNATRRALAGKDVHFTTPELVAAWEKKYPDYIPTDRVRQDAGWSAGKGSRGESPRKLTDARSGSGEQIVDPLISYKERLRVTAAIMGEQMKRIEAEKLFKDRAGMGGWALASHEQVQTKLGDLRAEKLKELGFEGERLHDLLKAMGADRAEEYFASKPWPTDGTKPTWGLSGPDGKLVNYRIGDRDLYNLLTGQQVEASQAASWLRATAGFLPVKLSTQAVKFGATGASLGFQARNIPRDIYTFWANTIDRMKANPRDLGDAYKRSFQFAWHQITGHFGGAGSTDTLFKRFAADRGLQSREFAFDPSEPTTAYGPNRGKVIETAHTVWGILRDTLNLAGAGEHAPRFLEWKTRLEQTTGKTAEQLTQELGDAEKAQADGKPIADPIPFALALDAMDHASEVTVNFARLGTVTREINKITPFFGPAIAGLSKSLRNWKDNPKGAAFAMGGLLGARLLHWLMFSDEDWYKELNSNDRYNNFVVPTPAGLRRFPAPRDLEVAGGGFLVTALDAATKKNPDLKGYLAESLKAVTPPNYGLPLPPAGKVGYELARNENWMGSPVVPKRDEGKSVGAKWADDRLPYAADQLTGGLLSQRKVPTEAKDLIPYSEVRNARRSVDEFYDRFHELEQARTEAQRGGVRYENEAEYHRLNEAQKKIVALGRVARGERLVNDKVVKGETPDPEKVKELRDAQIALARKAMAE